MTISARLWPRARTAAEGGSSGRCTSRRSRDATNRPSSSVSRSGSLRHGPLRRATRRGHSTCSPRLDEAPERSRSRFERRNTVPTRELMRSHDTATGWQRNPAANAPLIRGRQLVRCAVEFTRPWRVSHATRILQQHDDAGSPAWMRSRSRRQRNRRCLNRLEDSCTWTDRRNLDYPQRGHEAIPCRSMPPCHRKTTL